MSEQESKYALDSGWLVEVVNYHTCGAGEGLYGHEPGCGSIPIASVDELLAADARLAAVEALHDVPSHACAGGPGFGPGRPCPTLAAVHRDPSEAGA